MKLSIVLSTQPTQFQAATLSGELEPSIAQIAAFGYQGVELAIRNPDQVDIDALARLVRKYNLVVPAIGTGQAWNDERISFTDPDPAIRRAAIERIESHIPVAARFNAVIIIGLIRGMLLPGVDEKQAMTILCEGIQECCQAAQPFGVRLALEPINRYECSLINTFSQGLSLVKDVAEENFGLLLDTFHMNIEEPGIEESIQRCGDRLFHFHVADSNRWYPGAGHLDFSSILGSLQEIGYEGFVSGEFLPMPDPVTAASRNIEFLKGLLRSNT